MTTVNAKKEPLIHITRRDGIPLLKAWGVRMISVLLALLAGAALIYGLTGLNPIAVYEGIFDGAFGTSRRSWATIRDAALLLCVAVALTPAFKMRFWNIGAEGQILVGGLATAAVMIYGANVMPNWLLIPVMFLAAVAAGAIFGWIPAFFKAKWNTNETLFTLMLNYVAMQMVTYCIIFWENPRGSNTVGLINRAGKIGWLPSLFGQAYGWNVVIVALIAVLVFIYLRYAKQGYEIAVVGESENTARYAGINVGRVVMRTMLISGAICGIAGFILVSGSSHTISTSLAGGRGFTAIVVAWLSKFNVLVMGLISMMITFLEKGSIQIASQFNLNENASDMITGILLFFILGSEFFIRYKIGFRHHKEAIKA